MPENFHQNIRWNPDLQEWFCSACGRTSDHSAQTAAFDEINTFECAVIGTQIHQMTPEERANRANAKKLIQN
jgi:hypothetical protein